MKQCNETLDLNELTKGISISGNTIFWFSKVDEFSPDVHLALHTITYEHLPEYWKELMEVLAHE